MDDACGAASIGWRRTEEGVAALAARDAALAVALPMLPSTLTRLMAEYLGPGFRGRPVVTWAIPDRLLGQPVAGLSSIAALPDGGVACNFDEFVATWERRSGLVWYFHAGHTVHELAVMPDGRLVSRGTYTVSVWRLADNAAHRTDMTFDGLDAALSINEFTMLGDRTPRYTQAPATDISPTVITAVAPAGATAVAVAGFRFAALVDVNTHTMLKQWSMTELLGRIHAILDENGVATHVYAVGGSDRAFMLRATNYTRPAPTAADIVPLPTGSADIVPLTTGSILLGRPGPQPRPHAWTPPVIPGPGDGDWLRLENVLERVHLHVLADGRIVTRDRWDIVTPLASELRATPATCVNAAADVVFFGQFDGSRAHRITTGLQVWSFELGCVCMRLMRMLLTPAAPALIFAALAGGRVAVAGSNTIYVYE